MRSPTALSILALALPLAAEIVPIVNPGFEADGVEAAGFLNEAPSGWIRLVSQSRMVGVIGENRQSVADTPDGSAWAHLETDENDPTAGDDPPRIGQAIGSLADPVFDRPDTPTLWVNALASRRLNESTGIHATASLYAASAGAADWTGGTLIDSAVVTTDLADLTDGDPESVAALTFALDLDNAAARAAHPGGEYWLVLANTMNGDGSGGQLHLDRITAATGGASVLPITNHSFEDDRIEPGAFLSRTPSAWVGVIPPGRTVGVIDEARTLVANTSDGSAWAHLQTARSDPQAGEDPPRIGQAIAALEAPVFDDPAAPNLWVHALASRRLNESTTLHVTASLYAAPAGAADWAGGTLIASTVVTTNLTNLIDGHPGSVAELAFPLALDNAAARAAHPGGEYWIVLANTMAGDGTGGQLHLDRISARTGDATDPGPFIPPPPPIAAGDRVDGDLILFNDNGGWCWYQDERIIVDRDTDAIVVASVANYLGYGGEPRDGDMDVTTFDPATGRRTVVTLGTVPTLNKGDDHNVAALWQLPDGRYFAKHTGHNYGAGYNDTVAWGDDDVPRSFFRTTTLPHDGAAWDPEQAFTWPENGTFTDDVTYTNLHYMSAEGSGQGRLYNIARADDRTPHIAWSDDLGATWNYGGRLSTTTSTSTYSNGYFVFAGNGIDRIDFMCTERHPRDFNNSIYHGYIQGGKSHDSFGNVIDDDIYDGNAPAPAGFTPVWVTSPVAATSHHTAWTMEIEVIDGVTHGLFTTRYGTAKTQDQAGDADHRLFYARFDGSTWHTHELCRMGDGLHGGQQDYTGLGSIHPDDPSLIYISTEIDPRDDSPLSNHEIFKGVTDDQGATWSWTPVTENSTVDNLRPIIPRWRQGHTAVLWLRGDYPHQRDYDQSPVGIIERPDEATMAVTYLDADATNTTLADGSPLTPSGPTATGGAADGQWHRHTGLGNGGDAYTANENGSEDAPALRTRVTGLADGTYDLYAYFWSRPGEDWRIRAGFSTSDLLVFRRHSCQQAGPSQFDGPVAVLDTEQALYRAYLGRRTVAGGQPIDVFIDDFDGAASAGSQRTAYDGLGVARVLPVLRIADGEERVLAADSGPYAAIHNDGTLILKGDDNLEVTGDFTNNAFLDLLGYRGNLPAGFANAGEVLAPDNADLRASLTIDGTTATLSVPGYAGHRYQLQSSTTLDPDDWQDQGSPKSGAGLRGVPEPLDFEIAPLPSGPRMFYRVALD
jgi:hypothetical protein